MTCDIFGFENSLSPDTKGDKLKDVDLHMHTKQFYSKMWQRYRTLTQMLSIIGKLTITNRWVFELNCKYITMPYDFTLYIKLQKT
jgi:hypothetical protein